MCIRDRRKDLGTWNTLTDELSEHTMGNVVMDEESENTHVINELGPVSYTHLYEETEICLRVKELGYKVFFNYDAHVWHLAADTGAVSYTHLGQDAVVNGSSTWEKCKSLLS